MRVYILDDEQNKTYLEIGKDIRDLKDLCLYFNEEYYKKNIGISKGYGTYYVETGITNFTIIINDDMIRYEV